MLPAHPNYNSFGEWYDWAMVKFEPAEGNSNFPVNEKGGYYARNLYPCKVFCFLQANDQSIYAVVQCCILVKLLFYSVISNYRTL